MSDKKSDLGITLVELIPSKDVCTYIKEVLPDQKAEKRLQEEALEFVPDVSEFLP